MNINATLFLQAIVFAILVGFTMRYIWPPLTKALDERAAKIADGLSAADKAKAELTNATKRGEEQLSSARTDATTVNTVWVARTLTAYIVEWVPAGGECGATPRGDLDFDLGADVGCAGAVGHAGAVGGLAVLPALAVVLRRATEALG